MRANHNMNVTKCKISVAVSYITKVLKWEQITTVDLIITFKECCFLYYKGTKMRANHNRKKITNKLDVAVSYITKVLKWEQITTTLAFGLLLSCCFLYYKGTKMRANHNDMIQGCKGNTAVSYITKVLKWEQITTNQDIQ